jgi:hypothetical protein
MEVVPRAGLDALGRRKTLMPAAIRKDLPGRNLVWILLESNWLFLSTDWTFDISALFG